MSIPGTTRSAQCRLDNEKRLIAGQAFHIETHPVEQRRLVDHVDHAQVARRAIAVRTAPVVHEDIAGLDRELFLADHVHAAAVQDDDNEREVMRVQRIIRMVIQDEHIERKIPVAENQLALELDRLGRTTGHTATYEFNARGQCPK